ncbi:Aste57867_4663 [Aphanomyces stellatus]|uniref:Aste57867_4663 protein n=1 Tax=Aphanomyces stellatus TaxID=120398 RepID=A0A485KD79_9STRA|nr:hypothetical protein As57867_004650 [Aphanomyces stellatus]VFT81766.1 Aste57867_4663 [Aphanomyces stellatus]
MALVVALVVSPTTAFNGLRSRSAAAHSHTRTAQVDGSGGTLNDQILHQFNILRQAHGLNKVVWNDELAVDMQAWADSCPQKDGGDHGGPEGNQNLSSFSPCGDDCKRYLGPSFFWYDEAHNWDFNSDSCAPVDDLGCGHFVNSMNPAVLSIACGSSTCYNSVIEKDDSLVWCNYVNSEGAQNPPHIPPSQVPFEDILKSLTAGFE